MEESWLGEAKKRAHCCGEKDKASVLTAFRLRSSKVHVISAPACFQA